MLLSFLSLKNYTFSKNGSTSAAVVAALGNTAMLALLLANGANVNAADEVIHTLSINTHEFDRHTCYTRSSHLLCS
jgi:hypothetical protein